MFNPSNRNSGDLERYCSECNITFACDGSCGEAEVKTRTFCLCPKCWENLFGQDIKRGKHVKSKSREKCTILTEYLEALRKEKGLEELGDDC